mmetsp:Transcript_37469/g.69044  ORF Transcript_37469/g.69044 Transcript_37469/m.69044 type:complete len:175 (+) Transcript_37469:967-1491(+)
MLSSAHVNDLPGDTCLSHDCMRGLCSLQKLEFPAKRIGEDSNSEAVVFACLLVTALLAFLIGTLAKAAYGSRQHRPRMCCGFDLRGQMRALAAETWPVTIGLLAEAAIACGLSQIDAGSAGRVVTSMVNVILMLVVAFAFGDLVGEEGEAELEERELETEGKLDRNSLPHDDAT